MKNFITVLVTGYMLIASPLWALGAEEMAVSPSKNMIAMVYSDDMLRLYSLKNGALIRTMPLVKGSIMDALFFSKDGQVINAYSDEENLAWNVNSGKRVKVSGLDNLPLKYGLTQEQLMTLKKIRHVSRFDSAAYNAKKETFWTAHRSDIEIWQNDGVKQLARIELKGFNISRIESIAISKEGSYIALLAKLNTDDGKIFILNGETYEVIRAFKPQSGICYSIEFLDDAHLLLGSQYPVEVWDVKAQKRSFNFTTKGSDLNTSYLDILKEGTVAYHVQGRINAMDVDQNGHVVLTGAMESIRNLLLDSKGKIDTIYPNAYSTGYDVRFSPDKSTVTFVYHGEHVIVYESRTAKVIAHFDLGGVPDGTRIVKYSPSGRYIAAGSDGGVLSIIDLEKKEVAKKIDLKSGVFSLLWIDEEHLLAGTLTHLQSIEWKASASHVILESGVTAMDSYRDHNNHITIAAGQYKGGIKIFDGNYTVVKELKHNGVGRMNYALDGKHLVSSSEERVVIWETDNFTYKDCPIDEDESSLWAMTYDSMHHRIYAGGDRGIVYRWDESCKVLSGK